MVRGQTFTLEAVITALLLLTVVFVTIQAIPLTPLTPSTANIIVENNLETYAGDVLTAITYEKEPSILKKALLNWTCKTIYGGASGDEYDQSFSDPSNATDLKRVLINAFEKKGIAYNIELYYNDTLSLRKLTFIFNGYPSRNAVTVTQILPIYDSDPDSGVKSCIPDMDDSNLYNVLYVVVTVWRM